MNLDEYKEYYMDFVQETLGPAVKRAAHVDLSLKNDAAKQERHENLKNGLIVLEMVSFIESNFLQSGQMKSLRQFGNCGSPFPNTVNPLHLSCFIYIRDCVAHDPSSRLLPGGQNTTAFCRAIQTGAFPWASLSGSHVLVSSAAVHELHLTVLRFFGEKA